MESIKSGAKRAPFRPLGVCVPRRWTATAYDDDHFKGASHTFYGPLELEDLERRGGLP